jgi:hypothetical protein
VRLERAALTIAQSPSLPLDNLTATKRGNISLTISRESTGPAKYALTR